MIPVEHTQPQFCQPISYSSAVTALKEILVKVGEEGDVESKAFQVEKEENGKGDLRHR